MGVEGGVLALITVTVMVTAVIEVKEITMMTILKLDKLFLNRKISAVCKLPFANHKPPHEQQPHWVAQIK